VKKRYTDVFVSEQLLERLEREKEEAVGMARYGRFKNWLHYANLKSWQEQGWHFHYLSSGSELTDYCTCGLAVGVDDGPEVVGLDVLKLDQVQSARGHRNLPSLKGVCVAFIYDFEFIEKKGVYFYKALCQECRSYTELLPGVEARDFVDIHNQSCMSVAKSKVKE